MVETRKVLVQYMANSCLANEHDEVGVKTKILPVVLLAAVLPVYFSKVYRILEVQKHIADKTDIQTAYGCDCTTTFCGDVKAIGYRCVLGSPLKFTREDFLKMIVETKNVPKGQKMSFS